ncbi:DoxX family membrane protein [Pseudozobellia thermophila]|uniref:Thiosulfate dehydrogenase [quinone] large subunit n=1 Tax=Pseudozobellia thermophila TaxID=192903 RepID=A0A1M6EHP1_9FLAO|nr:DoxX family membrane protein [Pseudozobellia thermophila]SHI84798.1 thiosulfate dehydrogenase [quinone] large subunit [Pseudozobellia thermophila]
MDKTGYLILRLAIGLSMFGHGLVRLPKLSGFSKWMVKSFEGSMLPEIIVTPFSYALPVLELCVGLLLLIGLFTRQAILLGALIMLMLIFGTTLIENWAILPSQLIHVAFFVVLLNYVKDNTWALDLKLGK